MNRKQFFRNLFSPCGYVFRQSVAQWRNLQFGFLGRFRAQQSGRIMQISPLRFASVEMTKAEIRILRGGDEDRGLPRSTSTKMLLYVGAGNHKRLCSLSVALSAHIV